jgi:hypothetical protein
MKKVVIFFSLAFILIVGLSAQAKGTSDTKVFAIEVGSGVTYKLGTKAVAIEGSQTVSAIFGLTDMVQAGFTVINGNTQDFAYIAVGVFPISDLAVNLMFGDMVTPGDTPTTTIISGFGLSYNLFHNSVSAITTVLQVNAQYLFNDITAGYLGLGLNLKVGI